MRLLPSQLQSEQLIARVIPRNVFLPFHAPHSGSMFFIGNANALLSAALIVAGVAIPAAYDAQWLVGLLFAFLIALNAFFIRKAAKTFDVVVKKVLDHDEDIVTLQQISEVVLTDMLIESAGDPSVGRRKNDALLRMLLGRLPQKRRRLPSEIAVNE